MTSPRRPRLKVLDNGDMELPLASRLDPETHEREERPPVILPESPHMDELAAVQDIVERADKALAELTAEIPVYPPTMAVKFDPLGRLRPGMALEPDEYVLAQARSEVLRDRTRITYSAQSPHAKALIDIIAVVTGTTLARSDLPGWAGHWSVVGEVYARYMDPFGGRVAELLAQPADQTTGSES